MTTNQGHDSKPKLIGMVILPYLHAICKGGFFMSDYRNDIVKSVEQSLITALDPDTIRTVSNKLLCILGDYEITKRCTDIVVYDDTNDRIIKRYLACLSVDGLSKNTIYAYRRSLIRFFDFIGRPYNEIGVYDIRYYLASEKERGISDTTVETTRATLSAFFQWLTNEDMIEKNPCTLIKPIKCQDAEKFPFSAVELDALKHACKNQKERAIVELLVSSGIRVSELSNMDVSDIDFSGLAVHVRNGKGGKDRTTFMTDVARMHLQKYLLTRTDNSTALFTNKNHSRIRSGGIRFILKELGERANVSNVHPHRFRRTFATGLASRGMPIQEIQKLLGHSDINTTLTYVRSNGEKIKASYRQFIA